MECCYIVEDSTEEVPVKIWQIIAATFQRNLADKEPILDGKRLTDIPINTAQKILSQHFHPLVDLIPYLSNE